MWDRLKAWLREPIQPRDTIDWGSYGRRFGPRVDDARDPDEAPAARRWNEADTRQGTPKPRWHFILAYAIGMVVLAVGSITVAWWLTTLPSPAR